MIHVRVAVRRRHAVLQEQARKALLVYGRRELCTRVEHRGVEPKLALDFGFRLDVGITQRGIAGNAACSGDECVWEGRPPCAVGREVARLPVRRADFELVQEADEVRDPVRRGVVRIVVELVDVAVVGRPFGGHTGVERQAAVEQHQLLVAVERLIELRAAIEVVELRRADCRGVYPGQQVEPLRHRVGATPPVAVEAARRGRVEPGEHGRVVNQIEAVVEVVDLCRIRDRRTREPAGDPLFHLQIWRSVEQVGLTREIGAAGRVELEALLVRFPRRPVDRAAANEAARLLRRVDLGGIRERVRGSKRVERPRPVRILLLEIDEPGRV